MISASVEKCVLNYVDILLITLSTVHADIHAHFKHREIQHERATSAAVFRVYHTLKVSTLTCNTQHICI